MLIDFGRNGIKTESCCGFFLDSWMPPRRRSFDQTIMLYVTSIFYVVAPRNPKRNWYNRLRKHNPRFEKHLAGTPKRC